VVQDGVVQLQVPAIENSSATYHNIA
jgi:hypothetical protein